MYYFHSLHEGGNVRVVPGTPQGTPPVIPTPPTAESFSFTVTKLVTTPIPVLALATPGTRPLSTTPVITIGPTHGSAVARDDGTIDYTSNDYTGPDTLSYKVQDVAGLLSSAAMVSLLVTADIISPPPPPPPPPPPSGTRVHTVDVYEDGVYEDQTSTAPVVNAGHRTLTEGGGFRTLSEGGAFLRLTEETASLPSGTVIVDESGNTLVTTPGGDVIIP